MVLVGTTTGLVHVMRLLRDDRPDMPAPLALARRAVRDAAGQLSRDGAGLVARACWRPRAVKVPVRSQSLQRP